MYGGVHIDNGLCTLVTLTPLHCCRLAAREALPRGSLDNSIMMQCERSGVQRASQ